MICTGAVDGHLAPEPRYVFGPEGPRWVPWETIVLRRDGDTWTCVHEHLSPDPAKAEASS